MPKHKKEQKSVNLDVDNKTINPKFPKQLVSPKNKVIVQKKIKKLLEQQGILEKPAKSKTTSEKTKINGTQKQANSPNTSTSIKKRKTILEKTTSAKKTRIDQALETTSSLASSQSKLIQKTHPYIDSNNKKSQNDNQKNKGNVKDASNMPQGAKEKLNKDDVKIKEKNRNSFGKDAKNAAKSPTNGHAKKDNKQEIKSGHGAGTQTETVTGQMSNSKSSKMVKNKKFSKFTKSINDFKKDVGQSSSLKQNIGPKKKKQISLDNKDVSLSQIKNKKSLNSKISDKISKSGKKDKKVKKKPDFSPDLEQSDSDDENYIEKYFDDLLPQTSGQSESSDTDDSELCTSDSEDVSDVGEDEPGSEIPLDDLVNFYGQYKDKDGLPMTDDDNESAINNELVEYNDSFNVGDYVDSNDDSFDPYNSSKESYSDSSLTISDDSNSSFSFSDDYSPESDMLTESSLTYDTDESDDHNNPLFQDVIVPKGEAVMYKDDLNNVNFDSDCSEGQIFEFPNEDGQLSQVSPNKPKESSTSFAQTQVSSNRPNDGDESDDSCPTLVPIEDTEIEAVNGYDTDSDSWCSGESYYSSSCSSEVQPDMTIRVIKCNKSSDNKQMPASISNLNDVQTTDDEDEDVLNLTTAQELSEAQISSVRMCVDDEVGIDETSASQDIEMIEQKSTKSAPTIVENILEDLNKSFFFANSKTTTQVLLLLKATIYIHGVVKLTLLTGSAQCYGYNLKINCPVTIYSTRGKSLLSLKPGREFRCHSKDKFTSPRMSNDLIKQYSEFRLDCSVKKNAIVLLERCDNEKRVASVSRYMKENVFPNVNTFDTTSPIYDSQRILKCQFFANPVRGMRINPEWISIGTMQEHNRVVVLGGKGAGKSTLTKYLINSNLETSPTVLLLDLDIGQPECWLPQTVSATVLTQPILGDGHYYEIAPVKSIYYGRLNVVLEPIKYVQCVRELVNFCQQNYPNILWVVNTMGFTKGIGVELVQIIMKMVCPTDVIQIKSQKEANDFEMDLTATAINGRDFKILKPDVHELENVKCAYRFSLIESVSCRSGSGEWIASPLDCRLCNIYAHLGAIPLNKDGLLTSVTPVCAPLDALKVLTANDDVIKKESFSDLLNGNLVYLCGETSKTTNPECFGIGIVRAVNKTSQSVYLLPTCSKEILGQVDTLAMSNIPLPAAVFLTNLTETSGPLPFVYNMDENYAGSKQVVQITHRPGQ